MRPYLPHAFDQANFDFFSKTLRDVPKQRDRWKRGVQLVNRSLGEEVGRIYVAQHFPPEAERQTAELIDESEGRLWRRFEQGRLDGRADPQGRAGQALDLRPEARPPEEVHRLLGARDRARHDLLGDAVRAEKFDWNLQLVALSEAGGPRRCGT